MNESKTPVRIHCVTGETESASQPGSVALDAPRDAGDPESGSKPALVAVAPSGELDWELDIIEGRKNLCCERFPRLKWFVRSEWYLFFMCLFVIAQTSVSVGMTSGALSTIERRYNLSGEEVGFIASTYDIVIMVAIPIISYVGGKPLAHRPFLVGIFALVLALGCFIITIPQYVRGKYESSSIDPFDSLLCKNFNEDESCQGKDLSAYALLIFGMALCGLGGSPIYTIVPAYLDEITPKRKLSLYLGIFYACSALGPAVGFVLMSGMLGTWVDPGSQPAGLTPESKKWVGAWWLAFVVVGCALTVLAVVLLLYPRKVGTVEELRERHLERDQEQTKKQKRKKLESGNKVAPEDEGDETGIEKGDKSVGMTGITVSSGVNTPVDDDDRNVLARDQRPQSDTDKPDLDDANNTSRGKELGVSSASPNDSRTGMSTAHLNRRLMGPLPKNNHFFTMLRFLLLSPTFMLIAIGSSFESFTVSGFANFLPKGVESMFALSASDAAFTVGLVVIPGAAGGTFIGGLLLKYFKAGPIMTSRMMVTVAVVSTLLMFGFFIGCDNAPLAGAHVNYNPLNNNNGRSMVSPPVFDNVCNAGCGCKALGYSPVCGVDGIQYYNPCFAGCTVQRADTIGLVQESQRVYTNCSCVAPNPATPPADLTTLTATGGKCTSGCDIFSLYLFVVFVMMFVTFINQIPVYWMVLKSVPEQCRVMAMGINNLFFRALGSIPAPPIFGAVMDTLCTVHVTRCGETGSCIEYDTKGLRESFVLLAVVPKAVAALLLGLSIIWFTHPYVDDDEDDYEDDKSQLNEEARSSTALTSTSSTLVAINSADKSGNGSGSNDAASTTAPTTAVVLG